MRINQHLEIDERDLREDFILAGGPGGQHVNKNATAVSLRFVATASTALSAPRKARLLELAGSRATKDGEIIIEARRFRSREMNREDARSRLAALIRRALERPRPRRATKPTLASKRRRVEGKIQRGAVKRERQKPNTSGD